MVLRLPFPTMMRVQRDAESMWTEDRRSVKAKSVVLRRLDSLYTGFIIIVRAIFRLLLRLATYESLVVSRWC